MVRTISSTLTQLGLCATGLALLLCLRPLGTALTAWVRHSAQVSPAQLLLAAAAFLCAALGLALLLMGPALGRPVSVAARWQGAS
jgi:hypothetical protein